MHLVSGPCRIGSRRERGAHRPVPPGPGPSRDADLEAAAIAHRHQIAVPACPDHHPTWARFLRTPAGTYRGRIATAKGQRLGGHEHITPPGIAKLQDGATESLLIQGSRRRVVRHVDDIGATADGHGAQRVSAISARSSRTERARWKSSVPSSFSSNSRKWFHTRRSARMTRPFLCGAA